MPNSLYSARNRQLGIFVTPQHYGAVGNGIADDTAPWAAFQAATGVLKAVPKGRYLVSGTIIEVDNGAIGDANVTSLLTAPQRAIVATGIDDFIPREGQIVITDHHENQNIRPALYVAVTSADASGAAADARVGGIFSYVEQTGTNTNQYVKAIAGTAVNAAVGNNDATGVVGYGYKLAVSGGIGDVAANGGSAWQYSTEEGLVIGGEFSAHQNVAGTFASDFAQSGNNTLSLHVTTNSTGARAFCGIALDTFAATAGRYGFWNAMLISRSCFMENGAGEGIAGTVGINFGNNTIAWPEKAVKLGNANYHNWRADTAAIRMHGSSLDFSNTGGGQPGVRVISPTASPQGGYFGAYHGATGPDGTTAVTPMGAMVVSSDGYTSLYAYDAAGTTVTRVAASAATNAFLPMLTTGTTSLGASARLWSQLFAATATINTSDERYKTGIKTISDAILDAWERVEFVQYQFLDAAERKGDGARAHFGVIAQRVIAAFEAEGLDALSFGLVCYDEWDAEPEHVQTDRVLVKHAVYEQIEVKPAAYDANGKEIRPAVWADGELIEPEEVQEIVTVTPGVAAGNRYGIRYEEALCIEAAYQRRRADRMEARLARLEALL